MHDLPHQPEYVSARRVLLDALTALEPHLANLVLVGAQAVYHHTGDGDLAVPVMTTDADLALDTEGLADQPEIATTMTAHGFEPGANPGRWVGRLGVPVDLMVVPAQSGRTGRGARGARLRSHDRSAARITPGLEATLVDHTPEVIRSFERSDQREFTIEIAGPAALLVAKLVKIRERLEERSTVRARVKEKDALDVLRLLQASETANLASSLRQFLGSPTVRDSTAIAVKTLRDHALEPFSPIPRMASAAAGGDPSVPLVLVERARLLVVAVEGGTPC